MNRQVLRSIILLNALLLLGCGGTAPPTTIDAHSQNPYPTADSLLAHINRLLSSNPIDYAGIDVLFHSENDLQRRLVGLTRTLRPFDEMQHKVFERFGAGLSDLIPASPIAPMPPATIIDRSPQRALAETTFADGEPFRIYLVHIADRWWISGYTLERTFDDPRLAESLANTDGEPLAAIARSFIARIDRGEFESLEQVRTEWRKHLRSRH